ncbi:hypothetical protein OE88DRAFT_1718587 [Heliocybe sulcata]|uniref:ZZ-type domain-containing protein n=1 Tax=Heliocybe sulcata TaxID=5364 RepID=A0A5C3N433_9AGAM|nr:hypothetical protein OE88DRAFT_1718587 [Heliocybe sulcata]
MVQLPLCFSRPDRTLVVKCTFDRWNKRITFSSARNCSYGLLRNRVEQCFSLSASSFIISYKDDDGEVTDITNESDLTEAIHYFYTDASASEPASSASSILSGRSFGSKKITLRVHVSVDYDGPSLSDSSSLASLDDYRGRSAGSELSLTWSDDAVTISSRDTGASAERERLNGYAQRERKALPPVVEDRAEVGTEWENVTVADRRTTSPSVESVPEDSSGVFSRLKLADSQPIPSSSSVPLSWLQDQSNRTIKAMLGALPEPSEADTSSIGDLSLQRDERGKYYYSYTSPSSGSVGYQDEDSMSATYDPTRSSMQIDPNAIVNPFSDPQGSSNGSGSRGGSSAGSSSRRLEHSLSEPVLPMEIHPSIPPEVLQYLEDAPGVPPPPPELLTSCSECGVMLETIRYVCATCGEKRPVGSEGLEEYEAVAGARRIGSGSGRLYPPSGHQTATNGTSTSLPLNGHGRGHSPSPSSSQSSSSGSSPIALTVSGGYELCSMCIESAGVNHALEVVGGGAGPGMTFGLGRGGRAGARGMDALSQWRRAAPKQKGQLRHAYIEKVWGPRGWEDVEQDNKRSCKCSTCGTDIVSKRYKCASCNDFNLCIACYGQVHEVHPSHAFLFVPDKPARSKSDSDLGSSSATAVDPDADGGEPSMKHPGVKCAHCMQDIVGARFHCAICESVDICSNCESAGLPGNLDSTDDGHNSSHIMIKIPYPLESTEVQTASKRAKHLWNGRDAAKIGCEPCPGSPDMSCYARTVVSSSAKESDAGLGMTDHRMLCDGCGLNIFGVRYQCASCPSSPKAFSLCEQCEQRSYMLHDSWHIFVKLPRPVDRPLESARELIPKIYTAPVGPRQGAVRSAHPEEYLESVLHTHTWCDRCMTRIQGRWFHCGFCPKDLCSDCEAMDTHDHTHVFLVLKAPVNLQFFKRDADFIENGRGSPRPIVPYPIYRS